ncbi:MAG: hypothetical protein EOP26_14760 [Rhodococcus sp. (in: high G+C Gram-positive bacteria)]|nr:MAG: hypothetical protein EOP26_14760 [Rhodococcus sp. (in: high G+C Gram-positive bacteria)]
MCRQAPANTLVAYEELRRRTVVGESTTRHHRLKGKLATGVHNGVEMEQWQYEVTAGGIFRVEHDGNAGRCRRRVWYVLDIEHRTLWLKHAGTGHPKQTE